MMEITEPIIEKIQNNKETLKGFKEKCLKLKNNKTKDILMNFPVVYIHSWKKGNQYEIYVGESNNIFQRTHQHYTKMSNKNIWQHKLSNNNANLYIIGHEHFNKSLTLDIENRLYLYLSSAQNVKKVYNERSNPQRKYYLSDELDRIFAKIWNKLRKDNKELFPLESTIKDSAIFKGSPLHKLTEEQEDAKQKIIEKIINALKCNQKGQLIFVEGEAGTGKTVLNSSTFYELLRGYEENHNKQSFKCHLLVNHDEQITVYNQIVNRLGITDQYGKVVDKPTPFINKHSTDNPVDVVFVDEANLLLTQGKQGYQGKNQLKDLMDRAKVVVIMFDEDQILTTEQYWEAKLLEKYRKKAKKQDNYIKLENQLRIHTNKEVIDWMNTFVKQGIVNDLPDDLGGYDIQFFNSPEKLDKEISRKASKNKTKLSRLIATYDWEYSKKNRPKSQKYWEVKIGQWHKPWNRELGRDIRQKQEIRDLAWAEQPQTIDEVGSTFTIQGFDLNYAGVIIGPSVKYRNGHIIFDPDKSFNKKATRNRTLSDGKIRKFGKKLLRNQLNVLMKRGVNGLYIYAYDDELREKLNECSKKHNNIK